MYKNKVADATLNLCGPNVRRRRRAVTPRLSQRGLADKLQLAGLDLDKNAIQRIETGKRFVTDLELKALSGFLASPPMSC